MHMPGQLYQNFELLLIRAGDKYSARVIDSPSGQASVDFDLPLSPIELEEFLVRVRQPGQGPAEFQAVRDFGEKLYEAVFQDEVETTLRRSIDKARHQDAGLRLQLRLGDTPRLAEMPWEYLYDRTRNQFFALSTETPIVRYVELPEPVEALAVEPPLRILVMISSPSDVPPLDVDQEWLQIQEALSPLQEKGAVIVERLEDAQLYTLQQQLSQTAYHIIHYVGHGEFDSQSQDGVLLLEDEIGKARSVSGDLLGPIVHDHQSLRLVVLNACEGARPSGQAGADPYSGMARRLIQQGVPAALANQFKITDQAAINLARTFYAALSGGYPVDAALCEARKAIFGLGNSVEWGTSVLFMRSSDGRLFDFGQEVEDMSDEKKKSGGISINVGGNVGGEIKASEGDITEYHVDGNLVQGDSVGGDKITVGDITGSSNVAVGKNIQQSNIITTSPFFDEMRQQVAAMPMPQEDKEQADLAVKELAKQDVEDPDVDKVDKWLAVLEDIGPEVVELVVNAITNPGAAVGSGLRIVVKALRRAR
jgi:hypothetical protein